MPIWDGPRHCSGPAGHDTTRSQEVEVLEQRLFRLQTYWSDFDKSEKKMKK